ncbi:hypothetical protein EB796_024162 [Bugula neritina]|uniref:Uncharacterized protein n=1 Tax=Bugula neritina TaxID=10212 RepID=A0A7J7IVE8_BUGNE|nr:hypothetical protein EB796_024162 [Bugula neritina]
MSRKGEMTVTKDGVDDKYNRCCGEYLCESAWLLAFNFVFWICSIALLSLGSWNASGIPEYFKAGLSLVTYGLLIVSLLSFIIGIIGFISVISSSRNATLTYVILHVLLLLTQGGMYGWAISGGDHTLLRSWMWEEMTPFLQEEVSKAVSFVAMADYIFIFFYVVVMTLGTTHTVLTRSFCLFQSSVFEEIGCNSPLKVQMEKPESIIVMCIPALFQLLSFIVGCIYYDLLRKIDAFGSMNKVVPVTVVLGKDDSYPSTSKAKGDQSAASRNDVNIHVNSPSTNKSNDVLVKLADSMLGG